MNPKQVLPAAFLFLGIAGVIALALFLTNAFQPQGEGNADANKKSPGKEIDEPPILTEPVLSVHTPFPKMPSADELLGLRKKRLTAALKYEERIIKTPRDKSKNSALLFILELIKDEKNSKIVALSYSPGGKILACSIGRPEFNDPFAFGASSAGMPQRIEIWNLVNRTLAHKLDLRNTRPVSGPVFSPDGNTLASFGLDPIGEIYFWNAADGKQIRQITAPGLWIGSKLVFSPDGNMLAATCSGAQVRWWDIKTGNELARLTMPTECIGLALSPDGRHFATTSSDAVFLWSFPACKQLESYPCDSADIVRFSAGGDRLVAAGGSKLHLVDIESAKTNQVDLQSAIVDVEFVGAENKITLSHLGAGPRMRLLEIPSLKELNSINNGATACFCLSPSGRLLVYRNRAEMIAVCDVEALLGRKYNSPSP